MDKKKKATRKPKRPKPATEKPEGEEGATEIPRHIEKTYGWLTIEVSFCKLKTVFLTSNYVYS